MAYIGKVTLTNEWEKLEDLIKAQVDGQSAFAFNGSKQYQLQVDTPRGPYISGAYLCVAASEPTPADDGEHLAEQKCALYQTETGTYLWVKTQADQGDVKMSVSELPA